MEELNYLNLFDNLAKPNENIKEHTENLLMCLDILKNNRYIKDESLINRISESIKAHDLGKCNPFFQDRIKSGKKFDANVEMGHNILSYLMCCSNDNIVLYSVLNHHRYVENFKTMVEKEDICIENLSNIYKNQGINKEIYEIEDEVIDKFDKAEDISYEVANSIKNSNYEYIKVLGTLMKCDYAASAHQVIEYSPDFLEYKLDQMMQKWKKNNPSSGWNELQKYCIENRDKNNIIIAPTGMGKTEAALQWIGNTKGFFVLPLRAAINAIYTRVVDDIICNEKKDERVALLHGDSLSIYQNFNDESELDVYSYYDRSKKLAIPLTITTPDQLFDFIFKAKSYELKFATLSYSKTVIDEIQAYSSDLLAYMILGIQNIIDIGGKVSIFTATFPPFIYDLIGRTNKEQELPYEKYIMKKQEFKSDLKRHNIAAFSKELSAEFVYNHFISNLHTSKKYLIVCNTVKKAQEIYENLKNLGMNNINILHSKFIKKERSKKEKEIIDTGKTYINGKELNQKSEIWISTQIVEASLDIDFDYLFTELSDLNGLFQRFGRVNRKGVKSIDETNCFIFTEINTRLLKTSKDGTGFIDYTIYNLSKEAILGFESGIMNESKKQELINEYLTTERVSNSNSCAFYEDYWDKYEAVYNKRQYQIEFSDIEQKFRNIVSFNVFPVDIEKGIINEKEINFLLEQVGILKMKISDKNYNEDNRKEVKMKLNKVINQLMAYTVPVGKNDLDRAFNKNYKIELGKNNFVYYANCIYDETGFRRLNKEQRKKLDIVKDIDDSDAFI